MYIVNKGLVQVIGGPTQNSRVLAELGPGSVFGEIRLVFPFFFHLLVPRTNPQALVFPLLWNH